MSLLTIRFTFIKPSSLSTTLDGLPLPPEISTCMNIKILIRTLNLSRASF